jgi:acyl carrier protein
MNSDAKLATQVTEVILRQLHASRRTVGARTRLVDDLGADSIALVELTIVLEETFDIEISDEDAEKIRTVHDAIWAVKRSVGAQRGG